jgi:hypothetical protein
VKLVDRSGEDTDLPEKIPFHKKAWAFVKGWGKEGIKASAEFLRTSPESPLYDPMEVAKSYVATYEHLKIIYRAEGGGPKGVLAAAEELDPLHQSAVASRKAERAEERGDYETSGAERYNQIKGLIEFATIIVGAASAGAEPRGISGGTLAEEPPPPASPVGAEEPPPPPTPAEPPPPPPSGGTPPPASAPPPPVNGSVAPAGGPNIGAEPSSRAAQIHAAGKGVPKFKDLNPTVHLKTNEGPSLVARGPTRNLEAGQRSLLNPDEIAVRMRPDTKVPKSIRIHPDVRVLVRSAFEGKTPSELESAGQPFCDYCRETIEAFGGTVVTPHKAVFPENL